MKMCLQRVFLCLECIIGMGSIPHSHLHVCFRHERHRLEVNFGIIVLVRYQRDKDIEVTVCTYLELEGGGITSHNPLQTLCG